MNLRIPFFSRKKEIANADEGRGELPDDFEEIFMRSVGLRKNGIDVTQQSAMRSTAVFRAVSIVSGTVASLPAPVYRRLKPRGKERAQEHPVYGLLNANPNPRMTSFTFTEMMMAYLLLWGNCYAEIETDQWGQVKSLWPIAPWRVEVLETEKGDLFYRISLLDGKQQDIPAYAMLHVAGLGFDGKKGMSVIAWARRAVELTLATEQFGTEFFENGTNVGSVVTSPKALSDTAYERLKRDLRENYEGLGKSHKLMLLEEGLTFAKNTIPPNDAQFLETRKFQIAEIARMFGVPPHMLADLERATFSNIEHQSIEFVRDTIRPWVIRWEQTINWKLFTALERKRLFVEYIVEGLLRGDSSARAQFYKEMFMIGVYSQNDIREKENDNPIPGGDQYMIPLNMIPSSMVEEYWRSKIDAAKPPEGGDEQDANGANGTEGDPVSGQSTGGSEGGG